MLKSVLRSAPVQTVLGWLLGGYMALVKRTTRWTLLGGEAVTPFWRSRDGVIGAFWHSRVLLAPACWPDDAQQVSIVISRSPDGEFIARGARLVGLNVIRGSARNKKKTKAKGGLTAMRQMQERLAAGDCMAITPDGPRGPRMRANLGAIRLAQATQRPMLAMAITTTRRHVLNTWDRFILPFPFGRGVVAWEGPLAPPPPDADAETLEAARQALEDALNTANRKAETAAGVAVITPAAPAEADAADPDGAPSAGDKAPATSP